MSAGQGLSFGINGAQRTKATLCAYAELGKSAEVPLARAAEEPLKPHMPIKKTILWSLRPTRLSAPNWRRSWDSAASQLQRCRRRSRARPRLNPPHHPFAGRPRTRRASSKGLPRATTAGPASAPINMNDRPSREALCFCKSVRHSAGKKDPLPNRSGFSIYPRRQSASCW